MNNKKYFTKETCPICSSDIYDLLISNPESVKSYYKNKTVSNNFINFLENNQIDIIKLIKKHLEIN